MTVDRTFSRRPAESRGKALLSPPPVGRSLLVVKKVAPKLHFSLDISLEIWYNIYIGVENFVFVNPFEEKTFNYFPEF